MTENNTPNLKEEYTRAGSAYQVFKWYEKQQKDASGNIPVCIKPEPVKSKKSLN